MIDPKELRIGNIVLYSETSTEFVVTEITSTGIAVENEEEATWIEVDQFEGLPITQEKLRNFGFLPYCDGNEFRHHLPTGTGSDLVIEFDGLSQNTLVQRFIKDGDNDYVYIENVIYIHQLQNLYFALTGEELM